MKIGTPCNISVLLWCHCRVGEHPRFEAEAVQDAINTFLSCGAIEPSKEDQRVFTTTQLGKAWVEALCNVPPPKSVYVDEMGRIIEA